MRRSIAHRIRKLDDRKRALQSRLDKQERAKTTRRRILLGAFLLERLTQSGNATDHDGLKPWLKRELAAFLGRDADRALFADLLWPDDRRASGARAKRVF